MRKSFQGFSAESAANESLIGIVVSTILQDPQHSGSEQTAELILRDQASMRLEGGIEALHPFY